MGRSGVRGECVCLAGARATRHTNSPTDSVKSEKGLCAGKGLIQFISIGQANGNGSRRKRATDLKGPFPRALRSNGRRRLFIFLSCYYFLWQTVARKALLSRQLKLGCISPFWRLLCSKASKETHPKGDRERARVYFIRSQSQRKGNCQFCSVRAPIKAKSSLWVEESQPAKICTGPNLSDTQTNAKLRASDGNGPCPSVERSGVQLNAKGAACQREQSVGSSSEGCIL